MIRIKVCSCCGSPYEIDDADTDLLVCGECNPEDEDLIGLIDMEDFNDKQ